MPRAIFLPSIAAPIIVSAKAVRFKRAERGSIPPRHISPTDSIKSVAKRDESIPMSEPPSPPAREVTMPDIAPPSRSDSSENAPVSEVGSFVKYEAIAKVRDTPSTLASAMPVPMSNNIGRLSSFLFCLLIFSSEKLLLDKSYCYDVENMTSRSFSKQKNRFVG